MISARVEEEVLQEFKSKLKQSPHLTLQDFINYSISLFNQGRIVPGAREPFVLTEPTNET
jgi:hypothetical protein